MSTPSPAPVPLCPICQQPACSLAHVYDRLVAPGLNQGARVLARVCLLLAVLDLVGMAAGWWA